MEIRNGYGIDGSKVSGPVRVGDPLTLMIYMRSKYDGFDIVVNDCYAHNGANKRIQLIDEYGWASAYVFSTSSSFSQHKCGFSFLFILTVIKQWECVSDWVCC